MVNNETIVFWCLMGVLWYMIYLFTINRMVKKADPYWNMIELSLLPFAIIGSAIGFIIVVVAVTLFWLLGFMDHYNIKFIW